MDIDDDDDFYGHDEPEAPAAQPEQQPATETAPASKKDANEELEEGEEEDEGGAMDEDDDSDVDIVTERKDGSSAALPPTSRYSDIKNIPQRTINSDAPTKPAPSSTQTHAPPPPATQPPISTSKLDVNAIPIHKATNKPLTQVNIDTDLADHAKPWRKPGTDPSDYFNYGFDEFTWALYAQKQEALRAEYNPDAIAASNKKMLEDMTNMMMMSGLGMPGGGPGGPGGAGAGAGVPPLQGMPGMEGMPPEMQAMMQQMMAGGMDPSQMDMAAMAGMFGGGGPGGGGPGQGGQGQGFGGGFGGGQGGQGYGYEQQMAGLVQRARYDMRYQDPRGRSPFPTWKLAPFY
ncbi:hypothetical protein VTJ49DRAFT_5544 [Mycothermus thermophilus]|uniref:Pre-mRNA polyadenylation factor Fip1 domain-containing protein n=1 Tax=Humicola insolens TaxID=85995 RepID=A0ABR3V4D6_HUMIN